MHAVHLGNPKNSDWKMSEKGRSRGRESERDGERE